DAEAVEDTVAHDLCAFDVGARYPIAPETRAEVPAHRVLGHRDGERGKDPAQRHEYDRKAPRHPPTRRRWGEIADGGAYRRCERQRDERHHAALRVVITNGHDLPPRNSGSVALRPIGRSATADGSQTRCSALAADYSALIPFSRMMRAQRAYS